MTPDPNLPRGVQAFLFEGAERRRRAEEAAVAALRSAGLAEVILPVLDFAAPYDGVTADEDAEPYRFVDRQGELLSLRSDFTPMAARVLAPRLAGLSLPVELFYRGDVVRDEEVGVGRSREFSQVGAERYGDGSFSSDERMLGLLLSCASGVGATRLTLTLGYAGLLEALLSSVAPALTARDGGRLATVAGWCRERRVTAVEAALARAGARPADASAVARALLVGFEPDSALFAAPALSEGAQALRRARDLALRAAPGAAIVADLAGTPTAPYYTGLTYGLDAAGVPAPLAAGGRYDRLLARFGSPAPAVGFSIGVEALSAAMEGNGEEAANGRPLRIAVGKGRLLSRTLETFRRAGVDLPDPDGRRLVLGSTPGDVELLLLKDDDVPTYVAHGGADLGVVGSDRVAESGERVFTPVDLPFGECRVALIGRAGEPFRPNGHPVTVGTKYRRLARRFFDGRRIAHEVVPLAGSVELAAALKLTDVVVDLIETGGTIAANGLAEIETILPSRAVLIAGRSALSARRAEIAALVERVALVAEVRC